MKLDSKKLALLSLEGILQHDEVVVERLLQAKQELTFSSCLSSEINKEIQRDGYVALIEIRGKGFVRKSKKTAKLTPNSHDIAILDQKAQIISIIENKVWYHFDGAKGRKGVINPNIVKGIDEDIEKIQKTAQSLKHNCSGFLILHIITPQDLKPIPDNYRSAHNSSLKREKNNLNALRLSSISKIMNALNENSDKLFNIEHVAAKSAKHNVICLDVICAEVRAK